MKCFVKNFSIGMAFIVLGAASAWAQNDGKALYLDKCATCHGPDGMAKTAMGKKLKITDVKAAASKTSAAEMEKIVTNGKGQDMDAFGKTFSKDQIKAIVEYYRSLGK